MANLTTKYLGLDLKSPIIVGSSELNNSVDRIIKHEAAGAGAVVLKSLFEEQILMDVDALRVNNMHDTFADAAHAMTGVLERKFVPNPENVAVYARLYRLYKQLHDTFGAIAHTANLANVMKELLEIRDAVRGSQP